MSAGRDVAQVARIETEGALPVEDNEYRDRHGQVLLVTEVALGDPLGRDIRGLVWWTMAACVRPEEKAAGRRPYSTSLDIWRVVWDA